MIDGNEMLNKKPIQAANKKQKAEELIKKHGASEG
jgi:hypothetical protein